MVVPTPDACLPWQTEAATGSAGTPESRPMRAGLRPAADARSSAPSGSAASRVLEDKIARDSTYVTEGWGHQSGGLNGGPGVASLPIRAR